MFRPVEVWVHFWGSVCRCQCQSPWKEVNVSLWIYPRACTDISPYCPTRRFSANVYGHLCGCVGVSVKFSGNLQCQFRILWGTWKMCVVSVLRKSVKVSSWIYVKDFGGLFPYCQALSVATSFCGMLWVSLCGNVWESLCFDLWMSLEIDSGNMKYFLLRINIRDLFCGDLYGNLSVRITVDVSVRFSRPMAYPLYLTRQPYSCCCLVWGCHCL